MSSGRAHRCPRIGVGALVLAAAALLSAAAAASAAPTVPTGYSAKSVITGLERPTAVRFASDKRVFVAEKSGDILEYDGFADTTPTQVASLRTEVFNQAELGLLGMALDPGFPARPYLYVLFTRDAPPGGTAPTYGTPGALVDPCPRVVAEDYCLSSARLSRLTISRGSVVTAERVLIDGWCTQDQSHSIGTLAFDKEGRLYAGAGDGAYNGGDYGQLGSLPNPCGDPGGALPAPPDAQGGALRAQDLRYGTDPVGLDGTIIRVDPQTGDASATNPLAGAEDPNARRIVAYGFRNPYRFTIDPRTQHLWVGDVGSGHWEEIDDVDPDHVRDYGWPCYEGGERQAKFAHLALSACQLLYQDADAKPPLSEYYHGSEAVPGDGCPIEYGSAISGLAVEDGSRFGSRYRRALFFQDARRGCIWAMQAAKDGRPDPGRISLFASGAGAPVDLEFGPRRSLYYADFDGGKVVRISGPDWHRAAG